MSRKDGTIVRDWEQLALWPHQRQAVEMIRRYQTAGVEGSALIRMPTGTGKTGVMAVVAQCFPDTVNVLIVAPWAQLTGQIAREVEKDFWEEKLSQRPAEQMKPARSFTPSTLRALLGAKKSAASGNIFICTNQTLERVYADRQIYGSLRERLSLVLVDEGHREPAPAWAEAVRNLKRPTVLFTATPYRNDQRLFNVERGFIFRLSHEEAVQQRFIREVKFHEVEFVESARSFVRALLDYYHGEFQKLKPSSTPEARVIIRCETDNDITSVARELKRAGETFVAVHDTFRNRAPESRFHKVPDPKSTNKTFWVHQNKLIEGVDDPAFSLLAVFQPFGNARSLVQQIGRVIRNPRRAAGQTAYVFSNGRHKQRSFWESYLRYEERLGASVGAREVGPREVFDDFVLLHQDYHYLDGNFRQRFDPASAQFHLHLKYSLAANVYKKHRGFTFDGLLAGVRRTIDEEDYFLCNEAGPDARTCVFLYGRCGASPLLTDQTFMEVNLALAVVRETDNFIFHYDSEKLTPEYLSTHAQRVPARRLEGLLSGKKVRITQISLLNSDLALYSVRRRSLSAHSIEQLAPALADYAHFCSTASGVLERSGNSKRRYVGFTRARVSERASRFVGYDEYVAWVDSVAKELKKPPPGVELFDRYAMNVVSPGNHRPSHILFDIEDVEEDYLPSTPGDGDGAGEPAALFDDRCWDVDDEGTFVCVAGGSPVKATVTFRHDRKRFEIVSKELEEMYPHNGLRDGRRRNIVAHLNYEQCFRIITDTGLVYAHGQFYASRMPLFGKKLARSIDLRQILFPREELNFVKTEKGSPDDAGKAGSAARDNWERGSIFEYIAREDGTGLLASEKFKPDILVCDDLGTELADFIAAQYDPPRVCMIHAKADKKGGSLSASAFHEVCSQAVKNLGLLNPQWGQRPKKLDVWDGPWIHSVIGNVERRIRMPKSGMDAEAVWDRIERIIRHPAAVREVWVVMSDGMSRKAFVRRQKEETPPASVVQLIYLLQSTWSAVGSVGAIFKVFCKT